MRSVIYMKQIAYLEIIKQAAQITWRNKFLWVFGLFVFLGSIIFVFSWESDPKSKQEEILSDFAQKNPDIFLAVILAITIIAVALFLLRLLGNASLIKSANNIAVYKQTSFKNIISETKKYIGRLFLLEIIIDLVLGIIMIVLITPVFYLYTVKALVFCIISAIVAVIIGVGLIITAYFLRRYAYFFIVLGNVKMVASLEMAYSLLKKNIKESLLMVCFSLAISMLILFCFFLLFIILFAILFFLGLLASFLLAKSGLIAFVIVWVILVLVFFIILFSVYLAFLQTVWTFFFQEISLEKKDKTGLAEELEAAEKIPASEII